MDAWLDNVELKLDNLLTQVKWDKAWLRSSDLVNRNSAAQQQRREDELRAKNARYQSVLYDSAHVPVAVTVRIEAQEKPSKVADHSNTCTASPASFSALALASQYQKYNIKGSSASLIHEGFIDEDPQVLLRSAKGWVSIPSTAATKFSPANQQQEAALCSWFANRLASLAIKAPAELDYIVSFVTSTAGSYPDGCFEHFRLFVGDDAARELVVDLWRHLAVSWAEAQIALQFEEGEVNEGEIVGSNIAEEACARAQDVAKPDIVISEMGANDFERIGRLADSVRARRPHYRPLPPDNIGLRYVDYDTTEKQKMQRERNNPGKMENERDRRRRASYRKKTKNTPTKSARQLIHMRMAALQETLHQNRRAGSPSPGRQSRSDTERGSPSASSYRNYRRDYDRMYGYNDQYGRYSVPESDGGGRFELEFEGQQPHDGQSSHSTRNNTNERERERDRDRRSRSPEYRSRDAKRYRSTSQVKTS